jgi:16S rRNA (guanine1207-N2)-methyltransferase
MLPAACDPALDALFVPFATGAVTLADAARVLFVGARRGAGLDRHASGRWHCLQTFKPYADALNAAGLAVSTELPAQPVDAVLLLPPRQRDAARARFADALACLRPGGLLLASVANDAGARSAEADLRRLAGPLACLSKHRCRVFWTTSAAVDPELLAQWRALGAIRRRPDGSWTRPGLFAWDRVDPGTALLASVLPDALAGTAADLGGGNGALACRLLEHCPAIEAVDLFEAEAQALEPARRNLAEANARRSQPAPVAVHWHDVGTGLPGRYRVLVSNPPFHLGHADAPQLGQRFIEVAAASLAPGGSLWLVANRHLPYEATLAQRFGAVRAVVERDGYKVFEAREPRR